MYKVVRLCAGCANKLLRDGGGSILVVVAEYTWRGRKAKGLFCNHHATRVIEKETKKEA